MTKRAVCLILSLILPIVLLCGCSVGERLTLEEYKADVSGLFQEWSDYLDHYTEFVVMNVNDKDVGEQVNKLKANKATLDKMISDMESVLDRLDGISNPPKEYDKLHKRLKKAISNERKWAINQRSIHSAGSVEDFNAIIEKTNKSYKDDEESLSSVWFDIMMTAV